MGEIIWQEGPSGVAVSTSGSPAQPAGLPSTRVQITTIDGRFLQLNLTEWADLCSAVRQLAGEFPSPHPVALPGDARHPSPPEDGFCGTRTRARHRARPAQHATARQGL